MKTDVDKPAVREAKEVATEILISPLSHGTLTQDGSFDPQLNCYGRKHSRSQNLYPGLHVSRSREGKLWRRGARKKEDVGTR